MEQEVKQGLKLGGRFYCTVRDRPGGKVISKTEMHNIVPKEGIDYMLNAGFADGTRFAAQYLALYTTAAATTDSTYAVPVYTEFTSYEEANRPTWTKTLANQKFSNTASKASFEMSAAVDATLRGAALVSSNIKGDTAAAGAKLFAAGDFAVAQPVIAGNVVELTYEYEGSSS